MKNAFAIHLSGSMGDLTEASPDETLFDVDILWKAKTKAFAFKMKQIILSIIAEYLDSVFRHSVFSNLVPSDHYELPL